MTRSGRKPDATDAGAGPPAPPPFLAAYAALAEPRIAAFLDARSAEAARLPVDLRAPFAALRDFVSKNIRQAGPAWGEAPSRDLSGAARSDI